MPSPCTGLCRLDHQGVCEGCGRTRAEITDWARATPTKRLAVLTRLERRAKKAST